MAEAEFRRSPFRSEEKVREVSVYPPGDTPAPPASKSVGSKIDPEDPILKLVQQALLDGYGGVILEGPPGTSKSWYAEQIALVLAEGVEQRLRRIQFHASYQYEDFILGWVPESGTFVAQEKHLLLLADEASKESEDNLFVLVIDELSRADPARVFGEALTYVEATKRGMKFQIAEGREVQIPPNLVILATMNTFDRGVEEVDAAFDRRMAKIEMPAREQLVDQFLTDAGMADDLKAKVMKFYRGLLRLPEHRARIGHTYFMDLKTEDDLRRRWRFQLGHVLRKAYRLNEDGFLKLKASWDEIFPPLDEATPESGGDEAGDSGEGTPPPSQADGADHQASEAPSTSGQG